MRFALFALLSAAPIFAQITPKWKAFYVCLILLSAAA